MAQRRERARELYLHLAKTVVAGHGAVSIPPHANVQVMPDGAFVEAVVWIPNSPVDAALDVIDAGAALEDAG